METPKTNPALAVANDALFGAVGPCADPVKRVHRLYMVNTTAGNVKGQLGILAAMSRDNGVPAWYCERLQKLADALLTVGGLEAPNDLSAGTAGAAANAESTGDIKSPETHEREREAPAVDLPRLVRLPWSDAEDAYLSYCYSSANGAFIAHRTQADYLNREYHGGRKVRSRDAVRRRELVLLKGKPNAEVSDECPPLMSETEKPRTGTRSLH